MISCFFSLTYRTLCNNFSDESELLETYVTDIEMGPESDGDDSYSSSFADTDSNDDEKR